MPALSFSVFRDKILSGAKRHTIRAKRKHPIKVGDKLYMWWKQRSPKEKEKLGESTCIRVSPITITGLGVSCEDIGVRYHCLDLFAIADGFDNWDEMRDFFQNTHGLPFEGDLIEWGNITNSPYGDNFGKLITDTCPCGEMLILDCAGECGYED
ncbi:MAG: ASCH domain-containing protein [Pseudanabaena sp. M57BS1SP1A06MG]|nr:ASCH domain-containing protein [Pseudanabaena sp. M34BS1SP1A06MG]MCA6602199.1 ASCH domain-containing protein [Pseudanabaena sp. M57BS1SP1A06MG]